MIKYNSDIEFEMKYIYQGYNEKQKRLYAATEAKKLGRGGIKYISELLNISAKTINAGINELEEVKKNK